MSASEFRSQIAKHVIYITKSLDKDKKMIPLEEGDFFIIEHSNRFFSLDAIEQLNIALKSNQIMELSDELPQRASGFFVRNLTSILLQKDYSSIYAKEGFFIFFKKFLNLDPQTEKQSYMILEKAFVFVVDEFISHGEQDFSDKFCRGSSDYILANEKNSMNIIVSKFIKQLNRDNI